MPVFDGRLSLREKNNDRLLYQISRQAVTPADQERKTNEKQNVRVTENTESKRKDSNPRTRLIRPPLSPTELRFDGQVLPCPLRFLQFHKRFWRLINYHDYYTAKAGSICPQFACHQDTCKTISCIRRNLFSLLEFFRIARYTLYTRKE